MVVGGGLLGANLVSVLVRFMVHAEAVKSIKNNGLAGGQRGNDWCKMRGKTESEQRVSWWEAR